VLSQTDLERERYEARRKAQLDYNTDMKAARLEGLAEGEAKGKIKGKIEGLAEGKIIGVIQFCERLLKCPETQLPWATTGRELCQPESIRQTKRVRLRLQ
jgi:hypothetical protein